MRKVVLLFLLVFLVGCGNETLTIRSTLEGDSYLRNNIAALSQEQFSSLLSGDAVIENNTYIKLKETLEQHTNTRYLLAENRIYRYSDKNELLYVADWTEEDNVHKLDSILFP
ncbi:hypothetical protein [Bacillus sp. JCM 19041]|uniref:hypothetical protein n=1 Tax=Bacillus sp. JCM 19041 TaxID=1460637 RepID=UPI0006CFCDD8